MKTKNKISIQHALQREGLGLLRKAYVTHRKVLSILLVPQWNQSVAKEMKNEYKFTVQPTTRQL